MIPRSAAEGQEVNSRNADEVFGEHGTPQWGVSGSAWWFVAEPSTRRACFEPRLDAT